MISENKGWSVLHVEDQEDDYYLAREMLARSQGRKISLDWAANYDEAIEKLAKNKYDAVLVDYDLGVDTGLELVRKFSGTYPAPFILFTGRGSHEIDLEAMDVGATMYLTKSEANPLLMERTIRYAIERKRSQQAQQNTEEKFRKAFYSSPIALAITRVEDGKFIDANDSHARVTGYSHEEVLGHTTIGLGLYPDPDERKKLFDLLREKGSVQAYEMAVRAKSGEIRTQLYSLEYIELDQEQFVLVAAIDITERKQAEELLAYHADLLDNLHDAVYATDAENRITAWNKAAESLYGFSAEEVLGKNPDAVLRVEISERKRSAAYQQIIETGKYCLEVIHHTKDGRRLSVEANGVARKDNQGNPIGFVSVCRDNTERRQAEEALRQSQDRIQEVLESITDSFFEIDRNWNFTYVNHRAADTLGYNRYSLIGKNVWKTFPELVGSEQEEVFRLVMEKRHSVHVELVGKVHSFWYEYYIYPSAAGITIYMMDISERRKAEEALRESERRLKVALETSGLGIYSCDICTGTIYWDKRIRELWGIGPDEVVTNDTFISAIHPDDQGPTQVAIDHAMSPEGSGKYYSEYRVIHQIDRVERKIAATGQVYFDNGQPTRLVGTVREI